MSLLVEDLLLLHLALLHVAAEDITGHVPFPVFLDGEALLALGDRSPHTWWDKYTLGFLSSWMALTPS